MRNHKHFVLDTNTLISSFLLKNSVSKLAYDKARITGQIIMSHETFNELSGVFVRGKFDKYISLQKRIEILEELSSLVSFVKLTETVVICRDAKDDIFLSLALSAKADCIVSGDSDLLVLNPFRDIPIINPSDFLSMDV